MWNTKRYCRWCGDSYYAKKTLDRDGFCSPKHKQAHYRAYLSYVTQVSQRKRLLELQTVTPKKAKKKGKKDGKAKR